MSDAWLDVPCKENAMRMSCKGDGMQGHAEEEWHARSCNGMGRSEFENLTDCCDRIHAKGNDCGHADVAKNLP